jgi:NTE family protein
MKILLFLLLPILGFCQTPKYKNLALEGGGLRGIAYAGAFKVLEENGTMKGIENVAGSSAGAIAGMMISIGYNSDEIDSMLMSLRFQQFNDGKGGLIGKYKRIRKRFGMYKGDRYENWLKEMLLAKTGNDSLTFLQLHEMKSENNIYKDLFCTGTNISKQRLEVFSYKTTPNFSIATAVRISGGVPLYFTPVVLDNFLQNINVGDTDSYINYYVDGGMLCNYPISMFDSCKHGQEPLLCNDLVFNKETIGIKLERKEQIDSFLHNSIEIPAYNPKKIGDYLSAFSNLMMETMARKYPGLENEKGRTIFVDYGNTHSKIKKISTKNKRMLYENGIAGAKQFFETNKTDAVMGK